MGKRALVINPGSTSTKIAVFTDGKKDFVKNINHSKKFLLKFAQIADQFEYRKNMILDDLKESNIDLNSINIVAGRGGLLKPIEGGVYIVNEKMLNDIRNPMGQHESNLGGMIAYSIAKEIGEDIRAIIVDPTCVDEMQEISRISGVPELPRKSFLHALNQKAIGRTYAKELNKKYEDLQLIVSHMGGGISVGAHVGGKVIDVNNGLNGDGPMSPERSGGVPAGQLVELCFSGKYSKDEILKKLKGKGGLFAYLGTSNALEVEDKIKNGDSHAELIYDAMAYQVAKEIGALSTVLEGKVDGILLTGGLAYSKLLTENIKRRVKHLGPVHIYGGEGEMEALALNAFLVLNEEIEVKNYS